jgi:hypothetical protein
MDKKIKPFRTYAEAAYWSGGVVAEAKGGGFYSLHSQTYPGGVKLYYVGTYDPTHPDQTDVVNGFPPDLVERRVWASPDDGGAACICRMCE